MFFRLYEILLLRDFLSHRAIVVSPWKAPPSWPEIVNLEWLHLFYWTKLGATVSPPLRQPRSPQTQPLKYQEY